MELTRNTWTKDMIDEFQNYIKSFQNKEKEEWSKNILNTSLPVLCMTTPVMKDIIKKIGKGNYMQFIDLWIWEYYENTAINGLLINKIKEFDTKKKYLDIYSSKADNWATCDLLEFDIKGYEKQYLELSNEYIKSNKPFVRRIGLYILFNFIDTNIDDIFKTLDKFNDEDEYYVNMMIGWLLSECFIKQRDKTLTYLKNNKLNKQGINKCIQKCRESRRVSIEDKELLLQYKKH